MLKTLRLHNFRTFLNAEIGFTNHHLVIGKNNSGKTNLCAALRFLGATARGDLATAVQVVPGGVWEIENWATSSSTIELSCTCELPFEGQPHIYVYDLKLNIDTSGMPSQEGSLVLRVAHEQLVVKASGFNNVSLLENDGREARMLHEGSDEGYTPKTLAPRDATMLSKLYELETNRRAVHFRRYLSSWWYYALSPGAMRFGWRGSPSGPSVLLPHGDNLAVELHHLKNIDEARYRRAIEHVRLIEPDLEYINFVPAPDQPAVPMVALQRRSRATWHGLSDGTLRCLALAYIVETVAGAHDMGGAYAPLVIIEEPENGIYPGLLRAFFDLFQERAPLGQFIFTSHSPYFIDLFDAFRGSITLLRREDERTKVLSVPPPEEGPDRPMLSEEYSMELFG